MGGLGRGIDRGRHQHVGYFHLPATGLLSLCFLLSSEIQTTVILALPLRPALVQPQSVFPTSPPFSNQHIRGSFRRLCSKILGPVFNPDKLTTVWDICSSHSGALSSRGQNMWEWGPVLSISSHCTQVTGMLCGQHPCIRDAKSRWWSWALGHLPSSSL